MELTVVEMLWPLPLLLSAVAAVCVGGGRLEELMAAKFADGGDGAWFLCRQMKTDRAD